MSTDCIDPYQKEEGRSRNKPAVVCSVQITLRTVGDKASSYFKVVSFSNLQE